MITEQDLQAAIAECEGQRNPNSSTCVKLAAFYTIRDHMYPVENVPSDVQYSFAPAGTSYNSNTEFGKAIAGLNLSEIIPIMDELMTALLVLNPKLYNRTMEMVNDLNYTH